MKKLLVFLCVVFMILGVSACKEHSSSSSSSSSFVSTKVVDTNPGSGGSSGASPVPEPATILLLGSGLAGLAGYGRKKFKK